MKLRKPDSFIVQLHSRNLPPTAVKVGLHLRMVAVENGLNGRAYRSEEKLATECGLARMTVRNALEILAAAGLIRRGYGQIDLIVP